MRILFLTTSMDVGGIETNLVGLGAALHARGHDVAVGSCGGSLVGELERAGVGHRLLSLTLRRPASLAAATLRLAREVARERYTIVHAMSAAANLATLLVPRGGRTRFVVSPMGLQMSAREPRSITRLRNRLLTLRAEWILVISEAIRRELEDIGITTGRLLDCDIVGIDPGRFVTDGRAGFALRAELGLGDAPVVTTIGALEPRKSHELFLDAAAIVRRGHPGTRFLVVGEGRERAGLEAHAHSLGLRDAVVFTGARRDIPAILAATDVYVKPGVVEGFIGVTVLEAMAACRPVVAFDTRDVRAAVRDGETGLLVPRGDAAALARAAGGLLGEPTFAGELAARGMDHAVGRFALAAVAERLEGVYKALAGSR